MITQLNIYHRRYEPKGWIRSRSEAISWLNEVVGLIIRLLRPIARKAFLPARNDTNSNVIASTQVGLCAGAKQHVFIDLHKKVVIAIALLIITISTQATIITVKQDGSGNYETIQEAINASLHGDTVLVYPGTYFENVLFNSKKITLASLYLLTQDDVYIHNTIIDGNKQGSCVRIMQGEDETTVLCGFTLQNGSGTWGVYNYLMGGGIYIIDADPQIKDCYIRNNSAWGGGGIMVWLSNTFLSGCHIVYNYARGGGGISISDDGFIEFDSINRNSIYLNHAPNGADIAKGINSPVVNVFIDTFTVYNPDFHFALSHDNLGFPVNNFCFDILHSKIDPLNADLYVSPGGDNSNSGLTPSEPLRNIWYAYKKIYPDSLNPNSIYLLPGTYSRSTNNELFPIGARSYVSLVGECNENTILDAELYTHHISSNNLTKNYTCANISLINGNEMDGSQRGSVYLNYNKNVYFNNISIENCTGGSAFISAQSDSTYILNSIFSNNFGAGISCYAGSEIKKWISIRNIIVEKTCPSNSTGLLLEGGLGIGIASSYLGNYLDGEIINIRISENRLKFDPIWGNGFSSALQVTKHVNLDIINTTIGNNVVEDDFAGAAVRVDEGSVLNIYNSIFYGDSLYELTLGSSSGSDFPATANICYSNLEGGEPEIQNWYNQHTVNWLEGNIDSNPLWDTNLQTPYALPWNSPCIDAGVPMYEFGMDYPYIKIEDEKIVLYKLDGDTLHLPSSDLAAKPRIVNGRIDMGAYEYQDSGTYVYNPSFNIQNFNVSVYPNPFFVHTFISFELKEKAEVHLIIYNMSGNLIKKLMDARLPSGKYTLIWEGDADDGMEINPGAYFVSLTLDNQEVDGVKIIKKSKR